MNEHEHEEKHKHETGLRENLCFQIVRYGAIRYQSRL
jgi:hypothetical protein